MANSQRSFKTPQGELDLFHVLVNRIWKPTYSWDQRVESITIEDQYQDLQIVSEKLWMAEGLFMSPMQPIISQILSASLDFSLDLQILIFKYRLKPQRIHKKIFWKINSNRIRIGLGSNLWCLHFCTELL